MLNQQETFKLGERAPESDRFFCGACDRRGVETVIDVDKAQVFPFCAVCKAAGTIEPDQIWVRIGDRERWHEERATRWKELWK